MKDSGSRWLAAKSEKEASRSELTDALRAHGAEVGTRENLRCPFHDDKHPSATVKQSNGKWFFSCHASSCNVTYDIWDLLGLSEGVTAETILKRYKKEVLDAYDEQCKQNPAGDERREQIREVSRARDRASERPRGFDSLDLLITHVLTYRHRKEPGLVLERQHNYTDPDTGVVTYCVFRLRDKDSGKKSYSQAYLDSRGKYVSGNKPTDGDTLLPLYNRSRVRAAQSILLVEGEWDVEYFTKHVKIDGWAATTTPGGAGKSAACDLSPLAGKTVYLWADNDPFDEKLGRCPGEHHMKEIAEKLLKLDPPCVVRRIRHEELDLPPKGDIVEFLEKPEYREPRAKEIALKMVLQDAESLNATNGLRDQFAQIAAGTYEHIHIPDAPMLSRLSQALLPGSVTLMCAEPGAAKSFWVLEKAYKLHKKGRKVKVLMLEEDHEYWQRRALAQIAEKAEITEIEWVKHNIKIATRLLDEHEADLDAFMRRVEIAPSRPTLYWAAEWVEKAVAEGNDVVFVDPITAAANTDKAWIDDHEFLFAAKEAVKNAGSRLFLTTHPRLDIKGKPSLAGLAGGAAYPRFSQTVFWLRRLDRPESGMVDPGDGQIADYHFEREIQIRKARNGKGGGSNIANILDNSTLCFHELGEIVEMSE